LESAGGTALITVLAGGILGQRITSSYQEKLKEREMAVAFIQDQSKEQEDISARFVELVGGCMGASRDLISLTETVFDADQYRGEDRKTMAKQRIELRDKYNDAEERWAVEGAKLGLLIALHSHGQEGVTEGWRRVERSVTAYNQCAEEWYFNHPQEYVALDVARAACAKERGEASTNLDKFTDQLADARMNPTARGSEVR
jgi:hypothetical protein